MGGLKDWWNGEDKLNWSYPEPDEGGGVDDRGFFKGFKEEVWDVRKNKGDSEDED